MTSSTVRGVQTPRIEWQPPEIDHENGWGQEAVELGAAFGCNLFPWQETILRNSMAVQPSNPNKWAAPEVGIIVSRQNGKTELSKSSHLASLFLTRERLIIHSAHLHKTAAEAFRNLLATIENYDELRRQVKRQVSSIGNEHIELFDDRRIFFVTRTKSGGRGLSGDKIYIDEGMFFNKEQTAALMPTLTARPNPQIWVMGSAGFQVSHYQGAMRNRAIRQSDPHLSFQEWSMDWCGEFCPPDCKDHDKIDDVATYAKANPSLGYLFPPSVLDNARNKMDGDLFAQEHLGVGDYPSESGDWSVISEASWRATQERHSYITKDSPVVFSLAVKPDRAYAAIGVAGLREDDNIHGEITGNAAMLDYRTGTSWVINRCRDLQETWKPPFWVVDDASAAGSFIPLLEKYGIEVRKPTYREKAQMAGAFHASIVPRKGDATTFRHRGQIVLDTAVAAATKKPAQDLWVWDPKSAVADISPLIAVNQAQWGLEQHLAEKKKSSNPWVYYA